MTATANLNTIAIDVVSHYGQTAKNLFAAYRAGTERAVNAFSDRYEQLVERQPLSWINSEIKASLVASQQRAAEGRSWGQPSDCPSAAAERHCC